MKLLANDRKKTKETIVVLAFAFLWNAGVYGGARLIAQSWPHYDMTLPIDGVVPFVPWTVAIYFGCYLVWGINYYLCAKQAQEERDRFFCTDALSKAICFLIFILIPTTNTRPEIPGEPTVWNFLMKLLYRIDSPDNLFPSIHCLVSWLCWVGVRKRKDIPAVYRYFSLIVAIAVCISTLTTRQHVIVDVVTGVALAELCYFLSGFSKVRGIYTNFITRLFKLLPVYRQSA